MEDWPLSKWTRIPPSFVWYSMHMLREASLAINCPYNACRAAEQIRAQGMEAGVELSFCWFLLQTRHTTT